MGAAALFDRPLRIAHPPVAACHVGREAAASMLVAERLGEGLGLPEPIEHLPELAEHLVDPLEVEPQIDGLRCRLAPLGHTPDRFDGLLEEGERLPGCAALDGLRRRLAEVADGLLPQLARHRVMREALHVLR
jgi:hypothetical protein